MAGMIKYIVGNFEKTLAVSTEISTQENITRLIHQIARQKGAVPLKVEIREAYNQRHKDILMPKNQLSVHLTRAGFAWLPTG